MQQVRSIRVLLRPGKYVLTQAIQVHALPGVVISLETIQLPKNLYRSHHLSLDQNNHATTVISSSHSIHTEQPLPRDLSTPRVARAPARDHGPAAEAQQQRAPTNNNTNSNKPSFRNLFRCNRQATHDIDVSVTDDPTDCDDWVHGSEVTAHRTDEHATLFLRSRRHNEPAFRVQQGLLRLHNVEIQHNAHGLDIWNGNAAVQIQPLQQQQQLAEEQPTPNTAARPTAVLEQCLITSKSGRGIVNIDGGKLVIRSCAVVDCAATGIYIGGPGSSAHLEAVDVIRNGVGKHQPRPVGRGIARGHSGMYLEQGLARIHNCNISQNTLSGISVVSPDHAVLHLQQSSLIANGTHQLELPPNGTTSRQRSSVNVGNTLSDTATTGIEVDQLRSGWIMPLPLFDAHQQQDA